MIDFMVLGGPRSGTTWAANWLTTGSTFCLHDPLTEYTLHNLDIMTIPGRRIGMACTSTIIFPEWALKHPARKVLLYREIGEVNESLTRLGLRPLDSDAHHRRMLRFIDAGVPVWEYKDLFSPLEARKIWKKLLPNVPFDPYRHDLLCGMNIQPQFNRLPVSKLAVKELDEQVRKVLHG